MRKRLRGKRNGQTMVEYIIIVVVIAIAALVLFGIFGDTLRKKLSGAVSSLDTDYGSGAQDAAGEMGDSVQQLKDLEATGIE